jgi:hypothetical protein
MGVAGSVTPEAFERVAPGWRGSAYPGFGWLEEAHPEGGAKTFPSATLPGLVDLYRCFPGYRFATPTGCNAVL